MRPDRQAPYPFLIPGSVSGASGAQATLVLLVLVLLMVLFARSTVGDALVSFAGEFSNYQVWGAENNVSSMTNMTVTAYDAKVVSVDMPPQMTQGDRYTATITMKNTGLASWYADGSSSITLAAVGGSSGDAYRFANVMSILIAGGTIIRNGTAYSFNFPIVAPASGQYLLEFQLNGAESGRFGETAKKSIKVIPAPTQTPAPTPAPTSVPTSVPTSMPTTPPQIAYLAYGKFALFDKYGRQMFGGPWLWIYDGPLGQHNLRSSYFSEPSWPYSDWDIGGPSGQYHIYKDECAGSLTFNMGPGGNKGTVTFVYIN